MKTVKSLLLGTAAGFVALTGANAADLPLAEPVEYVRICDTYGKGYFYIPGTDTCLKVSGYVRVEAYVDFNDDAYDYSTSPAVYVPGDFAGFEGDDALTWFARGDVRFDARSETEWGTLRSFIELRATKNGRSGWSTDAEQAFIQFAGFTIGRAQSFFDFVPYDRAVEVVRATKAEPVELRATSTSPISSPASEVGLGQTDHQGLENREVDGTQLRHLHQPGSDPQRSATSARRHRPGFDRFGQAEVQPDQVPAHAGSEELLQTAP
jgi:hypothetical protein